MSSPTCGSLVPLISKEGQEEALAKFVEGGYEIVQSEPATLQWYGFKLAGTSPLEFNIFDAFPNVEGRKAHFDGEIPKALRVHGPNLLGARVDISKITVEILASNIKKVGDGLLSGLTVGLRVLFSAKPEKKQAVRDFLINALPLVQNEAGTASWYAIHFPDTDNFGIVDFFATEEDREAHLNGKVAAALFDSVDELLTGTPSLHKVDVLAAHVTA